MQPSEMPGPELHRSSYGEIVARATRAVLTSDAVCTAPHRCELVLHAKLVSLRIQQHDRLFTDADHGRAEPDETFDLGINRTRCT